jgi:hypothetical protein
VSKIFIDNKLSIEFIKYQIMHFELNRDSKLLTFQCLEIIFELSRFKYQKQFYDLGFLEAIIKTINLVPIYNTFISKIILNLTEGTDSEINFAYLKENHVLNFIGYLL